MQRRGLTQALGRMKEIQESDIGFGNYLVAFVDLLGQRNALRGQGVLPPLSTPEEVAAFKKIATESIGAIAGLQRQARNLIEGYNSASLHHLKEHLPQQVHGFLDDIDSCQLIQQRWSDGLVYYYCMRDSNTVRDLAAYYAMITRVGSLLLLGLARGQPIRGAIEVSWGVELHPNELYGAAIANSYDLESRVAQYPRVVIGNFATEYLNYIRTRSPKSERENYESSFAAVVLDLLYVDTDGHYCINYLGSEFMGSGDNPHKEIYPLALKFAESQLLAFQSDEKLGPRYDRLVSYLRSHAP